MKAGSSSSEEKRVACPDITCSTRPVTRPRATSVSARNCTTKARRGDDEEGSSACAFIAFALSRLWQLSLARSPAVWQKHSEGGQGES